MPFYSYKARDEKGHVVSGTANAQDEVDLHKKLKQDNLYLVSTKEASNKVHNRRIKSDAISEFARNLGELIGSGVTLVRALKIISNDESIRQRERNIYAAVLKQVLTGISLSDAMESQGDAFPPLLINMMRSSENTGNLDEICLQMANYYDKDYRLMQKVKSSMTYPKILTALIVVVVAIIMGYVIPQFESLFAQMDTLPVATTILLGISNFVKHRWYLMIFGIAVIVLVFKLLFCIPALRLFKAKMELHLPKFGYLRKVIYTARFARTLSSLYSAGISIMSCLQIAKSTIGNEYIELQFEQVIADIKGGETLSEAISKVDGFTQKLSSTIMVGEETGALDKMLLSVATQMEYDSEMALNRLVSYLEPVMIVVMATIVGFIMIAVIQPIYGSYEAIATNY